MITLNLVKTLTPDQMEAIRLSEKLNDKEIPQTAVPNPRPYVGKLVVDGW